MKGNVVKFVYIYTYKNFVDYSNCFAGSWLLLDNRKFTNISDDNDMINQRNQSENLSLHKKKYIICFETNFHIFQQKINTLETCNDIFFNDRCLFVIRKV